MGGTLGFFVKGLSIFSFLFLTACGSGLRNGQFTNEAPKSSTEAGLLVRFDSADQAQKFFDGHPEVKVRELHATSRLYEVRGISSDDFRTQIGAHQFIEKNKFYKNLIPNGRFQELYDSKFQRVRRPASVKKASKSGKKIEGEFDISKCVYRSKDTPEIEVPVPILDVDAPAELRESEAGPFIGLGETVTLSSNRTQHSADGPQKMDYVWRVWSPLGSKVNSELLYSRKLEFTPDMPGTYDVALLVRDTEDHCAIAPITIAVTYAEPFKGVKKLRPFEDQDRGFFSHLGVMSAEDAWQVTRGEGSLIAILDTGVNYNHPDLSQNIYVNSHKQYGKDFVKGTMIPFDDQGHGTHCAGLAASGVTGIAPNAKILPVKVLSALGSGDMGSIIAGILYAADEGADVISMSLASRSLFEDDNLELSLAYQEAIALAGAKGSMIVAAAGNETSDIDQIPVYPAVMSRKSGLVISVAATSLKGNLSEYSNFGMNSVDVAAPGGSKMDINFESGNETGGLLSDYYWPVDAGGKYGYVRFMGTSMATPVVAGVAALTRTAFPKMLNYQVKAQLRKTSLVQPGLKGKVGSSAIVNALAAVKTEPGAVPPKKGWTK